jgi:hypothetical protein
MKQVAARMVSIVVATETLYGEWWPGAPLAKYTLLPRMLSRTPNDQHNGGGDASSLLANEVVVQPGDWDSGCQ